MTEERRQYILIAFAYNCIMLAMALAALSVSVWLLVTGRLSREGVDAAFLLAAGLALGAVFLTAPARAVRDGLLRDVRGLLRGETGRHSAVRTRPAGRLASSHSH